MACACHTLWSPRRPKNRLYNVPLPSPGTKNSDWEMAPLLFTFPLSHCITTSDFDQI
ncbi:hypothetical protein HETIRDRAFT_174323 [Heterobasidion irregulare TC 32-1]|uniref:Uncharacterized protein n=1 Tax=Heterobasidion irregulare (strain TC 32-1) TaxID=747525 RepID=W4JTY8_HETIT|nr:uncharacterized protein HETIRDRAFT_174323 [Heterobasidion irregulare TC 32-1]ETW77018.1 hypothetical protein HETIRDRAFT_174323 [Heterobasidion irregulare TC 32-1]